MKHPFKRFLSLSVAALTAVGTLTFGASAASSAISIKLDGTKDYARAVEMARMVNELRTANDTAKLTFDKDLTEAAMQRAAEASAYFANNGSWDLRPNNASFVTVYDDYKLPGHTSGEIITFTHPNASSTKEALANWMDLGSSQSQAILYPAYTTVGVGCFYQPNGTMCWVQLFNDASTGGVTTTSAKTATMTVNILPQNVGATSAKLSATSIDVGGTARVQDVKVTNPGRGVTGIYYTPTDDCLTYTSSDTTVATVNSSGVITGVKGGTATISVGVKGADSSKTSMTITVKAPVVKPDPQPEVKPDPQPEVKPDPEPEVKPDPEPEVKPDPQPEVKPQPDTPAVPVEKKANTITASNVTVTTNAAAFQLKDKAKVSALGGAKLTYKCTTKGVTVTSSGKVTLAKDFVGKATITIKAAATDAYKAASKTVTLTVNPAGVKISSVKSAKKAQLTVKWAKNAKATGYQIQYSTDKSFKKSVKTATVTKAATTSTTLTKLTAGKKYYVRIRTYKTVSGTKYYSAWNTAPGATVKK